MKKTAINLLLVAISLALSLYLLDAVAGKFLTQKLLGNSWLNWRNNEDNFSDLNCYKLSANLGFIPIWGRCTYSDIVFTDKVEKEYRILILGDSNTKRGNFDKKLSESLTQFYSNQYSTFNVIKIGIESYNTKQEVELLKTELIKLKPDLIVLQFTFNDFDHTPVAVKIDGKIVYFSVKGEKEEETNNFLFEHSNLYRIFTLRKLLIDKNRVPKDKILEEKYWNDAFWQTKLESMNKVLGDYKDIILTENIKSVVLIYPVFDEFQSNRERDAIIYLLKRHNLEFIDLLPQTLPFGGPAFFAETFENGETDSIHPIRYFDTIVANSLLEYIGNIFKFND